MDSLYHIADTSWAPLPPLFCPSPEALNVRCDAVPVMVSADAEPMQPKPAGGFVLAVGHADAQAHDVEVLSVAHLVGVVGHGPRVVVADGLGA